MTELLAPATVSGRWRILSSGLKRRRIETQQADASDSQKHIEGEMRQQRGRPAEAPAVPALRLRRANENRL
ncbi:hypothetical protein [Sinorhizobium sp. Sb3]|uniref:hypothetical protein n=1 Tax=Sinorhizobium/Ensifer group TaxID=227292 RepID=UPI0007259A8B|nr:hypothetical protein [Sinorhizobium sp. Sb3]KSV63450.1 hypothetical protein N183_35565 [Sinorhizobium sp. Sb3]